MEEPPEDLDNQGVLTYIKKLDTYVSDLADTFLGFACDLEDSALILGKDFDKIRIRAEADHRSLGQDKDMEREHRTVCVSTRNSVELSRNRVEEATAATLKTQVSKIKTLPKNGFHSAGVHQPN